MTRSDEQPQSEQPPTFPSGEADCPHPRWVEWSAFGLKAGDRRTQCEVCSAFCEHEWVPMARLLFQKTPQQQCRICKMVEETA